MDVRFCAGSRKCRPFASAGEIAAATDSPARNARAFSCGLQFQIPFKSNLIRPPKDDHIVSYFAETSAPSLFPDQARDVRSDSDVGGRNREVRFTPISDQIADID